MESVWFHPQDAGSDLLLKFTWSATECLNRRIYSKVEAKVVVGHGVDRIDLESPNWKKWLRYPYDSVA